MSWNPTVIPNQEGHRLQYSPPEISAMILRKLKEAETSVEVHVLQGEPAAGQGQPHAGPISLVGIPPAPRGMLQIEVIFDIDANGILNVSARDTASGKQQQITITASSGLSKQEVGRMVREAEAHAREDARRRQEIEVRNTTDPLVYSTQRALSEHGPS
jgi:molecular chaperone DnaK